MPLALPRAGVGKKQREGTTAPPPAQAPPNPRTTHIRLHTETPQQPINEPHQKRTQPNTTTMDTQHSTEAQPSIPRDTDDDITQDNPTAPPDRRIGPYREPTKKETPKPLNWPHMTANQKHHWPRRHK